MSVGDDPDDKGEKTMKVSIKEITRTIKENQFAPTTKWEIVEIELVKTLESVYGMIDQYEITIRFEAGKYEVNGVKYLVNHYFDKNAYDCFYNGLCCLG